MKNINASFITINNEDFQVLNIEISGQLDVDEINSVVLPHGFDSCKGIVLNGPLSLWLTLKYYVLCESLDWSWFAVFYPQANAAVIIKSKEENKKVGEKISFDLFKDFLPKSEKPKKPKKSENSISKVIALIGPPHSGKSVFLTLLEKKLLNKIGSEYKSQFDVFRACTDGEGDHTYSTKKETREIIRKKNTFDD